MYINIPYNDLIQGGPKNCTFSIHHIGATLEVKIKWFSSKCSFYAAVKNSLKIISILLYQNVTSNGFS